MQNSFNLSRHLCRPQPCHPFQPNEKPVSSNSHAAAHGRLIARGDQKMGQVVCWGFVGVHETASKDHS